MKNYTAAVTQHCSVADGLNLNVAELQSVSKIYIFNFFFFVLFCSSSAEEMRFESCFVLAMCFEAVPCGFLFPGCVW